VCHSTVGLLWRPLRICNLKPYTIQECGCPEHTPFFTQFLPMTCQKWLSSDPMEVSINEHDKLYVAECVMMSFTSMCRHIVFLTYTVPAFSHAASHMLYDGTTLTCVIAPLGEGCGCHRLDEEKSLTHLGRSTKRCLNSNFLWHSTVLTLLQYLGNPLFYSKNPA